MKRITLYLAVAIVATACGQDDGVRWFSTKMNIQRAELYAYNVAAGTNTAVPSEDLRIKLFCDFTYINVSSYSDDDGNNHRFYHNNNGLEQYLYNVTVTCDKTIANIEAGEDLISIMGARVHLENIYDWSIEEWLNVLNSGDRAPYYSGGGYYGGRFSIVPLLSYEFDIVFLPYYVTVVEDDYVFTLTMNFGGHWDYTTQSNKYDFSYTRTFPGVHLK